jgi:predicted Zn-dependent protease with MMP-like domain
VYLVTTERFEEFMAEALADIPPQLSSEIENVAFFVEDESDGRPLLGLYEGIPLTRRSPLSYNAVMPDRITLYRGAICRSCDTEEEVRLQVRKTMLHEVAHHFGIDDPRLEELGWA